VAASEIKSRDDFFQMLARTTAEIDSLAAREPAYPVWVNLQRQLHAMREWTANSAQPTPEQLQRISIGLVAARELEPAPDAAMEDLITRLHLLSYYWKRWAAPSVSQSKPPATKRFMIVLAVIAAVVVLIIGRAVVGGLMVGSPTGIPLGRSIRTTNYIATLIETMEPYMASLNHNPDDERFRIALFARPLDVRSPGRMIPIVGKLPLSQFVHEARIIGDDGALLWFYVNEIGAFELKNGNLITARDLRRANPGLDDIWTDGHYELGGRMTVTTHDYRRVFEIDPATLGAVPLKNASGNRRSQPDERLEAYLCSGGLASPAEWFGVHTPAEVERNFKPGSSISRENPSEKSRAGRRIYRGRVETTGFGPRIKSMEELSSDEYISGAVVRAAADSQPLRLSAPDGFLLTYTSPPNPAAPGTLFAGTRMIARVDVSGKRVWTVDTGIGDLQQILPDTKSIALVGTRPMAPDKVSEPILVIVDNQTGAISTTSLWQ
jgi:hypothetical protein